MTSIMQKFFPEGMLLNTSSNRRYIQTSGGLAEAAMEQTVLEARAVLCDSEHNLHIELPCMEGIIPREEGAEGILEGTTRDIALISRVSKPVSFLVTGFDYTPDGKRRALCSRRAAQEKCRYEYLATLQPGDIVEARVTRLESFGAFCDIGCGVPALLPIAALSVSRISHPSDRLYVGMDIYAVVTSIDNQRICLSQRELLGTWEENAALFEQGETVAGIIRSVEDYGVFVELTPNLAGLAEPRAGVRVGQHAGVYIKNILADKMKLKLVLIDAQDTAQLPPPLKYFITEGHIDRWVYSPSQCGKRIETDFSRCQQAANVG